jgi:hypothetical protein
LVPGDRRPLTARRIGAARHGVEIGAGRREQLLERHHAPVPVAVVAPTSTALAFGFGHPATIVARKASRRGATA